MPDMPADDPTWLAVRAAWRSTLDGDRFDPDQGLADTGADSLRLMQFALRLERALGRRIAYDLLSPQTTPRSLAAALARPPADAPHLPRVHFLPGLGGDNGMLPMLRTGFGARFEFVRTDPPGLDQAGALLCDLDATAAWIASRIEAAQPDGSLRIAGYSMGGLQAFEAARHLVARGRDVALLCLFDAVPMRGSLRRLLDAMRAPGQLPRKLRERLPRIRRGDRLGAYQSLWVDLALRIGAYGLASKAARATAHPEAPDDYGEPDIFALWSMRVRAARAWRPTRLRVNTLLIVSEDGTRWGAVRFWRRLAAPMTVVPVPGSHDALPASCARSDALRRVLDGVQAVA